MHSTPKTAILTSGGVRSFVAAAAAARTARPNLVLLHLIDDRPNARIRSRFIRRQADHLRIEDLLESPMRRRTGTKDQDTGDGASLDGRLFYSRLLIQAMTRAIEVGAERLIWPASAHGQLDRAATVTEQVMLVHELARLEHRNAPKIETPLLEMTDKQLIELGGQLKLPWDLAWSCLRPSDRPCRMCAGCQRRREAFDAAGVDDPAAHVGPVHEQPLGR